MINKKVNLKSLLKSCAIILVGFFVLTDLANIILRVAFSSKPINDSRLDLLNADIAKMSNEHAAKDSVINRIKGVFNVATVFSDENEDYDTDNYKYFFDTTSTKALLLIRFTDIDIAGGGDEEFINIIDEYVDFDSWQSKEKYLGIFGKRSFLFSHTPTGMETYKDGMRSLLDYFGTPKPILEE